VPDLGTDDLRCPCCVGIVRLREEVKSYPVDKGMEPSRDDLLSGASPTLQASNYETARFKQFRGSGIAHISKFRQSRSLCDEGDIDFEFGATVRRQRQQFPDYVLSVRDGVRCRREAAYAIRGTLDHQLRRIPEQACPVGEQVPERTDSNARFLGNNPNGHCADTALTDYAPDRFSQLDPSLVTVDQTRHSMRLARAC